MNGHNRKLINVIATGFVVMVLYSLVLFWGRFLCYSGLINNIPEHSLEVVISPSGLVPGEPAPHQMEPQNRIAYKPPGPNEPNFRFSIVSSTVDRETVLIKAIGIVWDTIAETMLYRNVNERIYYWLNDKGNYLCLDKRSGLIIRHYKSFEPNDKSSSREADFFAGPNDISETPAASLGRFYDPIIGRGWDPNRTILYDKKTRRFYLIDFTRGSVIKGLQLTKGDDREPIAIGRIEKDLNLNIAPAAVAWNSPEIWDEKNEMWVPQRWFRPYWDRTFSYIPVLDKMGRIHIYDTKEQSLTQCGYLPVPQSLYNSTPQNEPASPRNVLDYYAMPVYATQKLPPESKKSGETVIDAKYLGMGVACVSREGTAMAAAIFDPNGKLLCRGDTKYEGISSAVEVYSDSPIASSATKILFLLENLQPPLFEIASYLCGNCIEASAGHRALFILPNSFLGMLGRYTGVQYDREVFLPLLMGPSLILSGWLAWRVRKDAKLTGLSNKTAKWWTAGTIAFGLPAYITYRLTRHKEVLVTCQNCGKLRRPDMETCHHCGSKWEIPELTPPNWRICD